MSNAALWGEQLGHQLTAARANAQIARAIRELALAEAYHCGTIAVLAVALQELRRLAPGHPLLVAAVRDVIDKAGTADGSFERAWEIRRDPEAIRSALEQERAAAVARLIPEIEQAKVEETQGGFLWLSHRWRWRGDVYTRREHVDAVRGHMLDSLREGTIDNDWAPDALKKAAWKAIDVGV